MFHPQSKQPKEDNSTCPSSSSSTISCSNNLNIPFPSRSDTLFKHPNPQFIASHAFSATNPAKRLKKLAEKTTMQRRSNRKNLFRMGFSSLLVFIGILLLMVSMMPVAVNACSTSTNPPICDPLPNGNGQWHAWQRVGSLGGIVDNFLQNYICSEGHYKVQCTISLLPFPDVPKSKAQMIDRYGSIETWDTSQVTNMASVFKFKNVNPDIRNWIVNSVVDMSRMFEYNGGFNRDLSSWVVSFVTNMDYMFSGNDKNDPYPYPSAYTHELCGSTWIESTATKTEMFGSTGSIGNVPCCGVGKHLTTTSSKTCSDCTNGKYQDETGFRLDECTKKCSVGKYSNVSGITTDNDCKLCSGGKWSNQVGLVSDDDCTSCVAGRYSDSGEAKTSIDVCLPCAAGRYSTVGEGQTSSVVECDNNCTAGTWSGIASVACTSCVAGFYSVSGEAQTSIDVCLACAEGRYSAVGAGQSSIAECDNKCSSGKWSDQVGLAFDSECKACPLGRFSNVKGLVLLADCAVCDNGYYTNFDGQTSCTKCPKGTFLKDNKQDDADRAYEHRNEGECKTCPTNHYQETEGSEKCLSCENIKPGYITATSLDPKNHDNGAEDCLDPKTINSGFLCKSAYRPINSKSEPNSDDDCEACPIGYYGNDEAQSCFLCPTGSFQDTVAQKKCTKCDTCSTFMPGATSKTDSLQTASLPTEFAFAQDNNNNGEGNITGAVSIYMNADPEKISDGLLYSTSTAIMVLLGLIALTVVLMHRYLPMRFKEADLLFAGFHFIEDTVSIHKLLCFGVLFLFIHYVYIKTKSNITYVL